MIAKLVQIILITIGLVVDCGRYIYSQLDYIPTYNGGTPPCMDPWPLSEKVLDLTLQKRVNYTFQHFLSEATAGPMGYDLG